MSKVRVLVRLNPDKTTFRFFVRNTVRRGAMLYTDGDTSYRNMPGYQHEAVNHGAGEYVREMVSTNGLESFWAMLKRAHKARTTSSAASTCGATRTSSLGGTTTGSATPSTRWAPWCAGSTPSACPTRF